MYFNTSIIKLIGTVLVMLFFLSSCNAKNDTPMAKLPGYDDSDTGVQVDTGSDINTDAHDTAGSVSLGLGTPIVMDCSGCPATGKSLDAMLCAVDICPDTNTGSADTETDSETGSADTETASETVRANTKYDSETV
jgi:hypothetical protein